MPEEIARQPPVAAQVQMDRTFPRQAADTQN
jgi:hypothetical protein